MGLGKTLQIIAVLIAISQVSPNASLEMPEHLRKDSRRFLVACPPGIVANWGNEFKLWTPEECYDSLGEVRSVSQPSLSDRMKTIERWYDEGGVLISISSLFMTNGAVGYSQIHRLLNEKKMSEEDLALTTKWLLDPGADLVVADEAHVIKNEKSNIAKLLARVKTGSRIATTGSPLSNHLEEYWSMMNWIHPDFLGSLSSFTGQYVIPIKAGLYGDSSVADRRTSQARLLKLTKVLGDKLHRRDISVIEPDLPQKTEFVIYVPLSALQRKLYEKFLEQMTPEKGHIRNVFKWINILRLICNHPYTLMVLFLMITMLRLAIYQKSRSPTTRLQGRHRS